MNVLITGAAGFVGRHVAKYLSINTPHRLIPVDLAGERDSPYGEIRQLDLGNKAALEALFQSEQLDAVIHLAALVNPNDAIENPLAYYASNVANTINLLQLCVHYGVGKFVFASTAAVYGIQECRLIGEDAIKQPVNPYSRSKLMCEQVLEDTGRACPGFNYAVLRLFFVVGSDGTLELGGQPNANLNVIRIAAQAALGRRDRIVIYGDNFATPDGTCVRDYIHIDDISRMFKAALDYLQKGNSSQEFNCGTGQGYSLKEITAMMQKVAGVDFDVEIVEPRPNEYPSLMADITRARELLDWEPSQHSLESLCRLSLEFERALP